MQLLKDKGSIEFVRIIIGNAKTGESNIISPTKHISVIDTNVEEIYEKILNMIKKQNKRGEKNEHKRVDF